MSEDYSKYVNMNFRDKFNCPIPPIEIRTCWACKQFSYCLNREKMLASVDLELEYSPPDRVLYETKGFFEPGRFQVLEAARRSHLYHNRSGETYF